LWLEADVGKMGMYMDPLALKSPSMIHVSQIDRDGFSIVPAVFSRDEVNSILSELTAMLIVGKSGVLDQYGRIYAARNVLALWPRVADLWRRHPLPELLTEVLGPRFGLVRLLYFDKPPEQSWSLPWHKDLTIAVRDNHLPTSQFSNPTTKCSVPHVEASHAVLEKMLTARIHLDSVTEENGPMMLIPGSHLAGKVCHMEESKRRPVLAGPGDVLLIRPLVEHNSLPSKPDSQNHRRILHLEFAASPDLPDGYEWHDFMPASIRFDAEDVGAPKEDK
jgi:phytanoyl-CoA dioxygenase PhyH